VLLLHHAESHRRTGVAAWVRRGLEVGAKIFYIQAKDEPPARALPGLLEDQPDAVEAIGRGQIQIIEGDRTAYDPAWQASAVKRALGQGYPSVRWSAEAATAWTVMPRRRHADIERATDRLCRSHPVSVMCQYSVRESVEALRLVTMAHGAGLRERMFQAVPFDGGLAFAGELDVSNQGILRCLLMAGTGATERDPFVVDLQELDFMDVGGTRMLLSGSFAYRSRGGHVVLRGPQPHVGRLMSMLGVTRTPGIRMEVMR
jgi:anti-anti-sigma factor